MCVASLAATQGSYRRGLGAWAFDPTLWCGGKLPSMLWPTPLRAQLPRPAQDDAHKPVPRAQRLQRLESESSKHERLRRVAKNVDSWGESRTNKTLWESWMCMFRLHIA